MSLNILATGTLVNDPVPRTSGAGKQFCLACVRAFNGEPGMMTSLMCLAMNPNLSTAEFMQASQRVLEAQSRAVETMCTNGRDLLRDYGPAAASLYVQQCLPVLVMLW